MNRKGIVVLLVVFSLSFINCLPMASSGENDENGAETADKKSASPFGATNGAYPFRGTRLGYLGLGIPCKYYVYSIYGETKDFQYDITPYSSDIIYKHLILPRYFPPPPPHSRFDFPRYLGYPILTAYFFPNTTSPQTAIWAFSNTTLVDGCSYWGVMSDFNLYFPLFFYNRYQLLSAAQSDILPIYIANSETIFVGAFPADPGLPARPMLRYITNVTRGDFVPFVLVANNNSKDLYLRGFGVPWDRETAYFATDEISVKGYYGTYYDAELVIDELTSQKYKIYKEGVRLNPDRNDVFHLGKIDAGNYVWYHFEFDDDVDYLNLTYRFRLFNRYTGLQSIVVVKKTGAKNFTVIDLRREIIPPSGQMLKRTELLKGVSYLNRSNVNFVSYYDRNLRAYVNFYNGTLNIHRYWYVRFPILFGGVIHIRFEHFDKDMRLLEYKYGGYTSGVIPNLLIDYYTSTIHPINVNFFEWNEYTGYSENIYSDWHVPTWERTRYINFSLRVDIAGQFRDPLDIEIRGFDAGKPPYAELTYVKNYLNGTDRCLSLILRNTYVADLIYKLTFDRYVEKLLVFDDAGNPVPVTIEYNNYKFYTEAGKNYTLVLQLGTIHFFGGFDSITLHALIYNTAGGWEDYFNYKLTYFMPPTRPTIIVGNTPAPETTTMVVENSNPQPQEIEVTIKGKENKTVIYNKRLVILDYQFFEFGLEVGNYTAVARNVKTDKNFSIDFRVFRPAEIGAELYRLVVKVVTIVDGNETDVAGALVTVDGRSRITSAYGTAIFWLENGTYTIVVTKSGFVETTTTVTISGAGVTKKIVLTVSEGVGAIVEIEPLLYIPIAILFIGGASAAYAYKKFTERGRGRR